MKNIAILFTTIISVCSYGQVVYNDSINHTSATTYLGVLGGPKLSTENSKALGFVTLRAGGMVTWKPNKFFLLTGLGAGEIDQTGTVTPFSLIGAKFSPCKTVFITVGKIATPMTELRPIPTSGSGQFEPWTKAQILGSAMGGKVTLNAKNFSLIAGEFWRSNDASTEFGIKIPNAQIAGYYMAQSKTFGGALNLSYKFFSTVVVFNNKQNAGVLDILEIPKTHGLSVYSDVGFNSNNWKLIRGEWGIFKSFSIEHLGALLGIGYSQESKSIKGYVFLHL
ncbi:MAG: hypothetical protein WAV23_03450 [Minisyncoccia bacterium]